MKERRKEGGRRKEEGEGKGKGGGKRKAVRGLKSSSKFPINIANMRLYEHNSFHIIRSEDY